MALLSASLSLAKWIERPPAGVREVMGSRVRIMSAILRFCARQGRLCVALHCGTVLGKLSLLLLAVTRLRRKLRHNCRPQNNPILQSNTTPNQPFTANRQMAYGINGNFLRDQAIVADFNTVDTNASVGF